VFSSGITPKPELDSPGRARERLFGLSTIVGTTLLSIAVGLAARLLGFDGWRAVVLAFLTVPAALQTSTALVRLMMRSILAPLEGAERTPVDPRGLPVVVPVILRSTRDIDAVAACVEENLPHVRDAPLLLLVDGCDSETFDHPEDVAILYALQACLAKGAGSSRVTILRRRRSYDPVDRVWRGWERKRGKIEEFCLLSRGSADTSFVDPLPSNLQGMEGFVTIDVDTRLLGTTVDRLAAAACSHAAIVVPVIEDVRSCRPSIFERWQAPYWCTRPFKPRMSFSQEYLGSDLFFGKGLILIDRFLGCTIGRIAERTVLSHDHLEAMLAGAVSEPTAIIREDVPRSRRHWERRQHRWMRGDYQVVPWIVTGRLPVSGRVQLANIVCAQAAAPASLAVIGFILHSLAWLNVGWIVTVSLILARPTVLLVPLEAVRFLSDGRQTWRERLRDVGALAVLELGSWLLAAAYLPRDAAMSVHAMTVVTWRRVVSGRGLLDWDDAAAGFPPSPWTGRLQIVVGLLLAGTGIGLPGAQGAAVLLLAGWFLLPVLLEAGQGKALGRVAGMAAPTRSAT